LECSAATGANAGLDGGSAQRISIIEKLRRQGRPPCPDVAEGDDAGLLTR
jgi:hypothetical protein